MFRRILALFFALAIALAPASAPAATSDDSRQAKLDGWSAVIKQMNAALKRSEITTIELERLRRDALDLVDAANDLRDDLKPEIAAAEERVQSLTPSDPTQDENDVVKKERAEQQSALDGLNDLDQQAHIVALQADELADTIADAIGSRFASKLFAQNAGLLNPALWRETASELPGFLSRLQSVDLDWLSRIAASSTGGNALLLLAALALITAAILGGRIVLRTAHRLAAGEAPTDRRKIASIAWILLVDVATPLVVLFGIDALLRLANLQPSDLASLFRTLAEAIVAFAIISSLARGMFAPGRPAWRIVGVSDGAAYTATRLAVAGAACLAIIPVIDEAAAISSTPAVVPETIGALLAVIFAAIVILIARTVLRDAYRRPPDVEPVRHRALRIWLPIPAAVAAWAVIGAALIGYLVFAVFLAQQIAWVWALLGLMVLAAGLVDAAVAIVLSPDSRIGRTIGENLALGRGLLNQLDVIIGGLGRVVVVVFGFLAMIAPWGLDSTSLVVSLRSILSGFQVGTISISFAGILAGIAIFVGVMALGRLFQSWLRNSYLPTTRLDIGLKTSILTAVNYIAILVGAAVAATYAGFDLANIAIVAGALSVGIGFGLQSIVNNFVSGLILLAERPIRTGDWIAVGGAEGTVKRISVRATEIETFDRASVIVPNSNIISGVVKNMYLRDNSGRITISLGVGYDSDPRQVESILLAVARDHKDVLHEPGPGVAFTDFGASALMFELNCFLADISRGGIVRSDLHFAILAELRKAGIEIPYPRRDLSLRDLPELRRLVETMASGPRNRESGQA